MKTAGLAFFAAGLLSSSATWAQSPFTSYGSTGYGPTAPPGLVPYSYGQLVQVPPNGCAWDNVVYSNGAVIAQSIPFTTYFQCERGTWAIVSPAEATLGRDTPEKPGRSKPTRP